jgi:RNA polymerase sigma-70 factor (ECF subfamily)
VIKLSSHPLSGRVKVEHQMTTDEQLMLEFQRGSHEAFTELFQRYRERVFAFFRRRVNDLASAEELAQETFLGVLRGVTRYEPRALFRTYLYGIALNLLAAHRRRGASRADCAAEITPPGTGGNLEVALWVKQALGRLEEDAREVLMLREYEQLSYAEIASMLRVPINTVRSRLFRARLALKELLVPQPGQS